MELQDGEKNYGTESGVSKKTYKETFHRNRNLKKEALQNGERRSYNAQLIIDEIIKQIYLIRKRLSWILYE